jgi:hypothetical protein
VVFAIAGAVGAGAASGAAVASDNAGNYTNWTNGSNGGTGFTAWTFTNSNNSGEFRGSSLNNNNGTPDATQDINTGGNAWGMFSNSDSGTNPFPTANAYRGFTSDPNFPGQAAHLFTSQTLSYAMDNGGINSGNTVGMSLFEGGSGTGGSDTRLEVYFKGGDSDYTVNDSTGTHDSGVPFTFKGLDISIAFTGPNSYLATLTPNGGTAHTTSGTLAGTSSALPSDTQIDTVRFFNADAGSGGNFDAFFNSLSVVPEPTGLAIFGVLSAGLLVRRRKTGAV